MNKYLPELRFCGYCALFFFTAPVALSLLLVSIVFAYVASILAPVSIKPAELLLKELQNRGSDTSV
jgi:hypothetical protein